MRSQGVIAKAAAAELALTSTEQRNTALAAAAKSLRANVEKILTANQLDMEQAEQSGLSASMLDRLMLDPERVAAMAAGLEVIAELDDPLGNVIEEWQRPNGLTIQRVSVPLGVIGIIYESRPNVTADAAALCLKSGNAVILRGGSESFHSSTAIHSCIVAGLEEAGIAAGVPRGGKRLIKRVQEEARVPVIGHLEGICHVYLHESADARIAREVVLNAKMRRTGICGAAESILVDRSVAAELLPDVCAALTAADCEIRGDAAVTEIVAAAIPASDDDWSTEYRT
jgi:glutamate-5-semialdehyde dehydrogenase